ncbi:MAG: hypothetical protein WA823_11690 [Candidatus Acidiferrales bacterium]
MAKLVMRISYALCLLCAVLALITRVMATFASTAELFAGRALPIGYHSFMDGVLLFFMVTLASAGVVFVDKRSQ